MKRTHQCLAPYASAIGDRVNQPYGKDVSSMCVPCWIVFGRLWPEELVLVAVGRNFLVFGRFWPNRLGLVDFWPKNWFGGSCWVVHPVGPPLGVLHDSCNAIPTPTHALHRLPQTPSEDGEANRVDKGDGNEGRGTPSPPPCPSTLCGGDTVVCVCV